MPTMGDSCAEAGGVPPSPFPFTCSETDYILFTSFSFELAGGDWIRKFDHLGDFTRTRRPCEL